MGLNNTATVMASGVAFVAVSLWVESRISRRRSASRRLDAGRAGQGAGPALDADAPKHEG
jgi:HAMP domain-containing protein